jgi:hypothetical protein
VGDHRIVGDLGDGDLRFAGERMADREDGDPRLGADGQQLESLIVDW